MSGLSMSGLAAEDAAEDACWLSLRGLDDDAPLVEASATSFELLLDGGKRLRIEKATAKQEMGIKEKPYEP